MIDIYIYSLYIYIYHLIVIYFIYLRDSKNMQDKHGTFILSHPYVPNGYTVVTTRIILHQDGQSMKAILMFNSVIVMAGKLSL